MQKVTNYTVPLSKHPAGNLEGRIPLVAELAFLVGVFYGKVEGVIDLITFESATHKKPQGFSFPC